VKLVLSRFACVRRAGDGLMAEGVRESVPIDPDSAALVARFAQVSEVEDAARAAGVDPAEALAVVEALVAAGVLVDPDAHARELEGPWDFEDLRFHTGTRPPASREWMRFWPPPPALPPKRGEDVVALPRPDYDALERDDPPLAQVQGRRRSLRTGAPLTTAQLGEFLYRVGRVEDMWDLGEEISFAPRPYPAAGALYEIELYAVVNECDGVESGVYHYRGDEHVLARLSGRTADAEALLANAAWGMAVEEPPSVLVVLGVRFGRISWKYGPLAYSLVLKNAGVVLQTMYLAATAMGLSPCAVGTGDSVIFARATGIDRDEVTSVGEFCLSGAPG
jgi:SagB-type dehydrogenase family enzyme